MALISKDWADATLPMRRPRTDEYGPLGKQGHYPADAVNRPVNQRAANAVTLKPKGRNMAAMTTAERQRRYRERAMKGMGGTSLTRLQTMLSPAAATDLSRITMMTGQTRRQAVETALRELARSPREEERNGGHLTE